MLHRWLGLAPYEHTWRAMRAFTENRNAESPDQIWLLEHPPVFTLGQSGRTEHLLAPGEIPVVQTDRGGQVTYHGPGQLVVYLLLDLQRRGMGVRRLVASLEAAVIALVGEAGISAERIKGAPGVYVNGYKLAALGIRVRRKGCYHGLALNVDMDLSPFSRINPCGYPGLEVTQIRDLGIPWSVAETGGRLLAFLEAEYT